MILNALKRRGMSKVLESTVRVKPEFLLRGLLILTVCLLTLVAQGVSQVSWADPHISWDSLNLSPEQENEIDRLESQWKRLYTELYPQIQRDKNELRRLLNSAQSDERMIMELQNRIQNNEQRLRQEATRTFLNKKGQLSPNQKVRLQQMMGQ